MANRTGPGLIPGFLVGIVTVLVVAALAGFGLVYSGAYNVAATEPHTAFTRWALDMTYHTSIQSHADHIVAPELTDDTAWQGAAEYAETCVHCHGAPGREPADWSRGMRPKPPHLVEAAAEWSPEEVFWIVRNGIKMSGMPAFGPRHTDEEIWSITAFVKQLPGMTSEEYQALTGRAGDDGGSGGQEPPAPPGASE